MLIAHITDPHIGLDLGPLTDRLDTTQALRLALAHVRRLDPAPEVLLLTGDLTDGGRTRDYATLHSLLHDELPGHATGHPRVLAVPGNHDLSLSASQALGAAMPRATDAPPGRVCFRVEHGGLHFIGLDTAQPGRPEGALEAAQLDWLDRQLRACADQPVLILLHHPPLTSGIQAMDAHGLRHGRDGLARRVAQHGGVQLIACGHLHRPMRGLLGGAPVVVAPSSAHQLELDLRPDAPLAIRLEPPMIGLYRWTPGEGMVCHFSHVQDFAGPYRV